MIRRPEQTVWTAGVRVPRETPLSVSGTVSPISFALHPTAPKSWSLEQGASAFRQGCKGELKRGYTYRSDEPNLSGSVRPSALVVKATSGEGVPGEGVLFSLLLTRAQPQRTALRPRDLPPATGAESPDPKATRSRSRRRCRSRSQSSPPLHQSRSRR